MPDIGSSFEKQALERAEQQRQLEAQKAGAKLERARDVTPEANRAPEQQRYMARVSDGTDATKAPVSGFERSGLVSDQAIQRFLADQPPEHLAASRIDSIEYVPRYLPAEGGFYAGRFTPTDGGYGRTGKIEIFAQTPYGCVDEAALKQTVAHEVGHSVQANLPPQLQNEFAAISQTSGRNEFVSGYARTSIHEDFAESYSFYRTDPEKLLRVSPRKYAFMRGVYSGRQYGPGQV